MVYFLSIKVILGWQLLDWRERPISLHPIGIDPSWIRLRPQFTVPEPLQHPLTEAEVSAASLGHSQAFHSNLTADATSLQAKDAAKVIDRVHSARVDHVRQPDSRGKLADAALALSCQQEGVGVAVGFPSSAIHAMAFLKLLPRDNAAISLRHPTTAMACSFMLQHLFDFQATRPY